MAVGLAVTAPELADIAFRGNKILEVDVAGRREIALVDVAVVAEQYVGARALWRTHNFNELYVTFAEPEVIGMSVLAGLLDPVDRDTSEGRWVHFDNSDHPDFKLQAPIAPGVIDEVGIKSWRTLLPDQPCQSARNRAPSRSTANANCHFQAMTGRRSRCAPMLSGPSTSRLACGLARLPACCATTAANGFRYQMQQNHNRRIDYERCISAG